MGNAPAAASSRYPTRRSEVNELKLELIGTEEHVLKAIGILLNSKMIVRISIAVSEG